MGKLFFCLEGFSLFGFFLGRVFRKKRKGKGKIYSGMSRDKSHYAAQ